ncbi:MAG: PadR family transcriptional regulator, partial [bacterium]
GVVMYVYNVVEKLNGFGFEVNDTTVYPILTRLQNKSLLAIEKRPSPLGPARKYYSLTAAGRTYLTEFQTTWKALERVVNGVMEVTEND